MNSEKIKLVVNIIMKSKDLILLPNIVRLTHVNSITNFKPALKYKIMGMKNIFRLPPVYVKVVKKIDKSHEIAAEPNYLTKPTKKDVVSSKLPKVKTPKAELPLKNRNRSKLRITSN